MQDVIILGAGLAGLGCARTLSGSRVFEAKNHPGGHAYSHCIDGVYFDEGAHICHTKDAEFLDLILPSAGKLESISPSVVRNHDGGRWSTYPVQNHLHELPLDDRIGALSDLVVAHANQSDEPPADYLQWCLKQYGSCLTDRYYARFTAKYWRTAMKEMSVDWLNGRLLPSQLPRIVAGAFHALDEKQPAFTEFRYPSQGGFFRLFAPLYEGIPIEYGERATEIDPLRRQVSFASGRQEPYGRLASSIPLTKLVSIVKDTPCELQEAAGRLRCTQLLCVNLIIDRPALTDCHWFYVYDENIAAARVSVPSNLSPESVPEGKTVLQAEIFRRDDEPLPVDELVEDTVGALSKLLSFDADRDVESVSHLHSPHAYPIPTLNCQSDVKLIASWLAKHEIHTMGAYGRWKFLWSDRAYRAGKRMGEALIATDQAEELSPNSYLPFQHAKKQTDSSRSSANQSQRWKRIA